MNKLEKLRCQLAKLQEQREKIIWRDGQIFKSIHDGVDYSIDGDIARVEDEIQKERAKYLEWRNSCDNRGLSEVSGQNILP